jgi:hypothetical protein
MCGADEALARYMSISTTERALQIVNLSSGFRGVDFDFRGRLHDGWVEWVFLENLVKLT